MSSKWFSKAGARRSTLAAPSLRRARMAVEKIEERIVPVATAWVNDNWNFVLDVDMSNSLTVGDTVSNLNDQGSGGPALTLDYGVDAFGTVTTGKFKGSVVGAATIADAVANTDIGGTTMVLRGNYSTPQIDLPASAITLMGEGNTLSKINTTPGSTYGVAINGSGTTVSKLAVNGGKTTNYGIGTVAGGLSDLTIDANRVTSVTEVGIIVDSLASLGLGDPIGANIVITSNVIDGISGALTSAGIGLVEAGGLIQGNTITNVRNGADQGVGIAVATFNSNFAADVDVIGNTVKNVHVGVSLLDTGGTVNGTTIVGNTIHVGLDTTFNSNDFGVKVVDSNAPIVIALNTINGVGFDTGVFVQGTAAGAPAFVIDNVIAATGSKTTAANKATGAGAGVVVADRYLSTSFSNAPLPTEVIVEGNKVTGFAQSIHVASDSVIAEADISMDNVLSGNLAIGTLGLIVSGANAKLTGDTLGNLSFSKFTGQYIEIKNGAYAGDFGTKTAPGEIDGTNATFDLTGKQQSGAANTLAQNFSLEDRIFHTTDDRSVGFVRVRAGATYVTPISSKNSGNLGIENGAFAAIDGDTVNIKTGIYNEAEIDVFRSVTLNGEGTTPSAVVIRPTAGGLYGIQAQVPFVTVQDLTVDGTLGKNLIGQGIINDFQFASDNFVVTNTVVMNTSEYGIAVDSGGMVSVGNVISNNTVMNVLGDSVLGGIAAIEAEALITGNTVTNVRNKTNDTGVGIASSIFLPAPGPSQDVTVSGNKISGVAVGVSFIGSGTTGSTIVNNVIDLTTDSIAFTGDDIGIKAARLTAPIAISNNTVTASGKDGGVWVQDTEDGGTRFIATITGNTLNSKSSTTANLGSGAGIFATSDGTEFFNVNADTEVFLADNKITGFNNGVLLLSTLGTEAAYATFGTGNILDGTGTTTAGAGLTVNGRVQISDITGDYDMFSLLPRTINNAAFKTWAGNFIVLANGALDTYQNTFELDATLASFDGTLNGKTGAVAASPMTMFNIEDKIVHQIDDSTLEFVRVHFQNVYVTTKSNAGAFQRGIDAASDEDIYQLTDTISIEASKTAYAGEAITVTSDVIVNSLTRTATVTGAPLQIASLAGPANLVLGGSVAFELFTGDASSTQYTGNISGKAGITYQGTGTFELAGVNTFAGALTINSGVVDLSGELSGVGGNVIVNGKGVDLVGSGTGVINGRAVIVNGTGADIGFFADGLTITGNMKAAGVTVNPGATARVVGNVIGGNMTGIDVFAGKAMIQENDLSGNTSIGLYVRSNATTNATVDAGQLFNPTDFTGLGASTGFNSFLGYGLGNNAIVNRNLLAPNNQPGVQGYPFDTAAQQNDYGFGFVFAPSAYQFIEEVISHDFDNKAWGFVNYASTSETANLLGDPVYYSRNANEVGVADQRSMIRAIRLVLDNALVGAAVTVDRLGAFAPTEPVTAPGAGPVGTKVTTTFDPIAGAFYTDITFLQGPRVETNGSLIDGNYELNVTGGGLEEDIEVAFHRLYGDVNGDRSVNEADRDVFLAAYRTYVGNPNYRDYLDFDLNNVINGTENFQFTRRFGLTINP